MGGSSLNSFNGTLVLAGAGKMGGAMLNGWLANGLAASKVSIVEPQPSPEIAALATQGVRIDATSATAADVLVVAVKPQVFAAAAPALRGCVTPQTLVISIMAGVPLAKIKAALGGRCIRAMPNTPAAIGRGISVAVAGADTTDADRALADTLLRAAGAVEWVDDEALMDAVTAVSGSGPAYVFLLAEELAKAGEAAGLAPALAATLARETVAGAGELLHRSSEDAATLRRNVTSPGGTTAAALSVLMAEDALRPLLVRAVAAATERSRQLAAG
jgi:pyrroline-5-carboxylate reductase